MMTPPLPRPLNSANVVTASDLVRHFGIWQDRASREPVYVLHRGRPRFVLTSVEIMQALCAPHQAAAGGPNAGIGALLDITRDIVLLVDRDLMLIATSSAARSYFGERAHSEAPLAALAPTVAMLLLCEAVRRVIASGLIETIDIAAPFAGRTLNVVIHPCDTGAIVLAHDITVVDDLASVRAQASAEIQAMIATGLTATSRLSLRGYVETPVFALASLAGIEPQALAGVRFVTLIESSSRTAVGKAIEASIEEQTPQITDTLLLVAGAKPRAVRLGFSPIKRGSIVEAVALIVAIL